MYRRGGSGQANVLALCNGKKRRCHDPLKAALLATVTHNLHPSLNPAYGSWRWFLDMVLVVHSIDEQVVKEPNTMSHISRSLPPAAVDIGRTNRRESLGEERTRVPTSSLDVIHSQSKPQEESQHQAITSPMSNVRNNCCRAVPSLRRGRGCFPKSLASIPTGITSMETFTLGTVYH